MKKHKDATIWMHLFSIRISVSVEGIESITEKETKMLSWRKQLNVNINHVW